MAVITEFDTELEEIPVSDPASDILHRAADYIEENGWVRHLDHEDGKRCAASAIFAVDGHPGGYGPEDVPPYVREAFSRLAEKVIHNRPSSPFNNPYHIYGGRNVEEIVWWNDHVARDQDHVVRTLREVA